MKPEIRFYLKKIIKLLKNPFVLKNKIIILIENLYSVILKRNDSPKKKSINNLNKNILIDLVKLDLEIFHVIINIFI
jgi:hypothetical protein